MFYFLFSSSCRLPSKHFISKCIHSFLHRHRFAHVQKMFGICYTVSQPRLSSLLLDQKKMLTKTVLLSSPPHETFPSFSFRHSKMSFQFSSALNILTSFSFFRTRKNMLTEIALFFSSQEQLSLTSSCFKYVKLILHSSLLCHSTPGLSTHFVQAKGMSVD